MRSDELTAAVALAPVVVAKGDTVRLHLDPASILGYVLVGLVVGLVARLLVPGRDPIGLIGTILIGVIGSVPGGWLAGAMFPKTTGIDGSPPSSWPWFSSCGPAPGARPPGVAGGGSRLLLILTSALSHA